MTIPAERLTAAAAKLDALAAKGTQGSREVHWQRFADPAHGDDYIEIHGDIGERSYTTICEIHDCEIDVEQIEADAALIAGFGSTTTSAIAAWLRGTAVAFPDSLATEHEIGCLALAVADLILGGTA